MMLATPNPKAEYLRCLEAPRQTASTDTHIWINRRKRLPTHLLSRLQPWFNREQGVVFVLLSRNIRRAYGMQQQRRTNISLMSLEKWSWHFRNILVGCVVCLSDVNLLCGTQTRDEWAQKNAPKCGNELRWFCYCLALFGQLLWNILNNRFESPGELFCFILV